MLGRGGGFRVNVNEYLKWMDKWGGVQGECERRFEVDG